MTKRIIMEILAAHKNSLNTFGVSRIGLMHAKTQLIYSPGSEIDLMVDLKQHKNDFNNFMSLAAFLEEILEHKINLILMQPRRPYLSPKVLDHTEFISTEGSSLPPLRALFSRQGKRTPKG